jgi:hypothetical protein
MAKVMPISFAIGKLMPARPFSVQSSSPSLEGGYLASIGNSWPGTQSRDAFRRPEGESFDFDMSATGIA